MTIYTGLGAPRQFLTDKEDVNVIEINKFTTALFSDRNVDFVYDKVLEILKNNYKITKKRNKEERMDIYIQMRGKYGALREIMEEPDLPINQRLIYANRMFIMDFVLQVVKYVKVLRSREYYKKKKIDRIYPAIVNFNMAVENPLTSTFVSAAEISERANIEKEPKKQLEFMPYKDVKWPSFIF